MHHQILQWTGWLSDQSLDSASQWHTPPCDESAIKEEDKSDTSSSSEIGVMVTCESEGQHSSQLTSAEDDQTSGDGGNAGNLMEEHPTLPWRSNWQKRVLPIYHIYDHEIGWESRENWDENHHSPQHICSMCKIYFFDWKKHCCPERAYIANVFSCRQSCKTTESEDAHANEGRQKRTEKQRMSSLRVVCFCIGHKLIRGGAAVSLKRG